MYNFWKKQESKIFITKFPYIISSYSWQSKEKLWNAWKISKGKKTWKVSNIQLFNEFIKYGEKANDAKKNWKVLKFWERIENPKNP